MKKNISINLFGSLYCIDEDAYVLLQKYTDSMKSYFARQEGGEEIADDIEHRVAELMWQKKEEGNEAIDIDMIKEIMAKIGNPAEIDGKDEESAEQTASKTAGNATDTTGNASSNSGSSSGKTYGNTTSDENKNKWNLNDRHLYRNPKDKKLGGVCSGLALFFNGGKDTGINDATFWRLGFLGMTVFLMFYMPYWMPDVVNISVPVFYVILWIIMPEAKTPEDMLRMKGKDVTPENINEEILHESATNHKDEAKAHASYQQQQNSNSGCLKILFGGCLVLMLPMFLFVLLMLFVVLMTVIGAGRELFGNLLDATPLEGLPALLSTTQLPMLIGIIAVIVVLVIIIWLIIRWLRGSDKKMSATSIVCCILGIVLGLGCAIVGLLSSAGLLYKNAHIYISTTSSDWEDPEDWVDDDDNTQVTDTLKLPADTIVFTTDSLANDSVK